MKLHEIAKSVDPHANIRKWLDKYYITNYTIRPDGIVDVDGDVFLRGMTATAFPVQFGHVSGWFNCAYTPITSLQGAPTSVGGSFYCVNTSIKSLQGAPTSVGGDFNCACTPITSLQGAPTSVGGYFNCYNTPARDMLKLFNIKGLKRVYIDFGPIDYIINKWLPSGDFSSCQDELIEAGFKQYATQTDGGNSKLYKMPTPQPTLGSLMKARQPTSKFVPSLNPTLSEEEWYRLGHTDGRAKVQTKNIQIEYVDYYNLGLKHGRGKQRNIYGPKRKP